jgi:hypothetical protein
MNYLILSLKHTVGNTPTFWRPDNSGYTDYIQSAGLYTEEQIKSEPSYYNDGFNTLAIPCTTEGLESIGLKTNIDLKKVKTLKQKARKEASNA